LPREGPAGPRAQARLQGRLRAGLTPRSRRAPRLAPTTRGAALQYRNAGEALYHLIYLAVDLAIPIGSESLRAGMSCCRFNPSNIASPITRYPFRLGCISEASLA